MGLKRWSARRDANEQQIVATLQARGFCVLKVSGVGAPDLIVAKGDDVWLVEVKQPKGRYKPAQEKWMANWRGPKPITVRTVGEALTFPARVQSSDGSQVERLRGKETI